MQQQGLRYSADDQPGVRRHRAGRSFRYADPAGRPLHDPESLARIHALAVPPAWTDVWICPDARGHVQATGRDARGRKQYRYHAKWRQRRDRSKYSRLIDFGSSLTAVRHRVDKDMARPGLPREKVLAAIVRLLDTTNMRIGNDEYARTNKSFGLSTLRNRHDRSTETEVRFHFRGKSGRRHDVSLRDRRLATIVRRCHDLPGQDLFAYLDESGGSRPIGSTDVNEYLREISGSNVTAKDFRTWAGTLLAFRVLRTETVASTAAARTAVTRSAEVVAGSLGNTPAVSRQSYMAPAVIDGFISGSLPAAPRRRTISPGECRATRREELDLVRYLAASQAPRRTD